MSSVSTEHIEKKPGVCGGRACIAGHRIRVMDVAVLHKKLGLSPAEIVPQYPGISLADVHAALAYFLDHRRRSRTRSASTRRPWPSCSPAGPPRCRRSSLAEPIRFFLDQHIPGAVSTGLRQHGVDVRTAQEANRCGATDEEQLAFATAEGRVVVTFDTDFLALDAASVPHADIAWCPATKYSIGRLIQALLLVHGVLNCEDMRDHV
jgi:uncharacterized protein (DUF433 family)